MINYISSNCIENLKTNKDYDSAKCNECLNSVFFPSNFSTYNQNSCIFLQNNESDSNLETSSYVCPVLGNLYFCRYCTCYVSEYLDALNIIFSDLEKDIISLPISLNMFSLGCGPSFDLVAYFYKQKLNSTFNNYSLNYLGFELSESAWVDIHDNINNYIDLNSFFMCCFLFLFKYSLFAIW